jgi:hypothetical protein
MKIWLIAILRLSAFFVAMGLVVMVCLVPLMLVVYLTRPPLLGALLLPMFGLTTGLALRILPVAGDRLSKTIPKMIPEIA